MAFPKISIVTPSFNQARYLEATLRSVLDQGYPNLEYIVIDGGSNDGSVEIIRKYQDRLAYWISERDRGQTDAINKGIARCTGDIFGYLNSDDLLTPGSLECVAEQFQAGAQWVVGWTTYVEPNGRDWPSLVRPIARKIDWFLHNPIPQPSSFWARQLFQQVGTFRQDMHYSFDYEYWLRLRFEAQLMPTTVRKCLSIFRLHDQSKTVAQLEKFQPELDTIHAMYRKYLSPRDRLNFWIESRQEQAVAARDRMWQALKRHDVKAARHQALVAVGGRPLSLQSWKTLLFALRGTI